ncbi:MAG: SixA phosphatase family protein [Pseudobdellovibrionaceae bacterium]|jgi:broad specificity phosphatase PhoE
MQLYLIRHGEKTTALHGDPALTNHGHAQAANLKEYLEKRKLPLPTQILCSTKIRTQQTMEPLAKALNIEIQISENLEEKSSLESGLEFETRIEKVLESFKENQITCVCSHYDWVIVASQILLKQKFLHHGACHHWQPCQVVFFEKREDDFFVVDHGVVST